MEQITKIKRHYFPTGELMFEFSEVNGKKEGEYKVYYINGSLEKICNYVNNKLNGHLKIYDNNGRVKLEFGLAKGKKKYDDSDDDSKPVEKIQSKPSKK